MSRILLAATMLALSADSPQVQEGNDALPDQDDERAWGQPTGLLSADETARLSALGCTLGDHPFEGPEGPEVMHVWLAGDGGYLGPGSLSEVRGYLRWLIKYGITPERNGPKHSSASVGRCDDGEWAGWSHRAASKFPTRAEAAAFAESVS